MCGISGIISRENRAIGLEDIKKITDLIQHRGPDDEGYHQEGAFAFGHRRLSILDLSPDGHQPMPFQDRYVITYNGEVYNYLEIKEELVSRGYAFRSKTDTEVILAAFSEWGTACVERFNGMWAFAIFDREKQEIFCSRDRFGVKPFYYTQVAGLFAFGSEIKQFTALPGWKPRLNPVRLLDFFVYGLFDHTEQTLFEGVFQLRGGHNLHYSLLTHQHSIQPWYQLQERVKPFSGSFREAKDHFRDLFQDAVRLRLRSDVKVGSCLSGGLDSSAIVCTVNQLLKQEGNAGGQETVSSCFELKQYDEQEYIDEVIAQTGVYSNKVFPEFSSLFSELENITWHQDEPFSSTSIFAQWSVFKEARRRNLIVMLDGQGADESLAGYPLYYETLLSTLLTQFRPGRLRKEIAAFRKLPYYSGKSLTVRLLKSFLPAAVLDRIRHQRSSHELQYVKQAYRRQEGAFEPSYFGSIRELSLDQVTYSHLPMLLHYEDRDSMAHSVESRVPFLDYRLVEFILGLPDEFKINAGWTKYVLREAMAGIIPDKIKDRRDKMAFVTPEVEWIRQNTGVFREKVEAAAHYFGEFLAAGAILAAFDQAVKEGIGLGSIYWRLIVLHVWAQRFGLEKGGGESSTFPVAARKEKAFGAEPV
ncbi:asparagine synthase (glutamine-hydrolyzing) [soil metagenome]